ncbi:hypothetical protein AXX12_10070 [Anaerosporomusa subterranea]|uniref:Solute-binding protein family 5 domain-containing protein n=1 Tax=Anaerosporomusa subterranea TaxID=1794912 RepID=A0A154BTA2_ANASB|nr:ABC transporter substrate-binding protein [Anaerosporomusa subterranea]KYZ76748.1 hypothetical protein AXX12_10070 [Anaerosporomusa subterranea]
MLKQQKRLLLLAVFILSLSLALAGCGGDKKEAKSALTDKLVIAQSSDALFLDPQQQDEGPTNSINSNIYDGLINRKADLSIIPGLAEKWEQKDPVTWVFYLRKNVIFHNGNAFTADDVVYTIERFSGLKVAGSIVSSVSSVKKIDDYTVEIKTKAPYAAFLADMVKVMIIDKEYVTKVGDQEFNLKPIGTGPYKVKEWIKADHITLEAFDKYWNGPATIKTVIFRPISNEATRTAALLSGEVQLIADVPVRDSEKIQKNEKLALHGIPSLRLIYLTLDVTRDKTPGISLPKNPFKEEKVRQAVRMAIDNESIIKNVMNGHAFVANQGNPKQVAGYVEGLQGVKYNPEQAKKLLAEAGYPNGFTVTLDASNDRYPNDSKVAEALAAQLAKVGITVNLNIMPKSIFFNHIRPGDKTTICLVGWSSDTADAGIWYRSMFYSRDKLKGSGGSNRGHFANAEFDALVDKADASAKMDERTKYLQDATKLLDKEMPFIPIYFQESSYGAMKNIEFNPRLDDYIYAYDIKFKK